MCVEVERMLLKTEEYKKEKVEVNWGEEITNFVYKIL